MKNAQSQILKAMGIMVLAVFSAQAQVLRCDITGKDTTGGIKQCLDLTALKGKDIRIPNNVTRIDNLGLAECSKADTTTAGIVFVVDQSSSMDLRYVYVTPTKSDTFYYEDAIGCPGDNTYSPPNTYGSNINTTAYPPFGTIQIGSRFIPVMKSNTGCQHPSGDPFIIRQQAVAQAVQYIAQVAPTTVVGYLPFANTVLNLPPVGAGTHSVRPLLAPLAATSALSLTGPNLAIASVGGTNYNRPVDSAKTWLKSNDPVNGITKTLGPKSIRAVIFISDGRTSPEDSNGFSFINQGDSIQIYGIYLGKLQSPDTVPLLNLTNRTKHPTDPLNSNFFRVPPDRADSITGVIRTFLSRIIKTYTPTRVVITNTNSPTRDSSVATTFGNQGGTGSNWRINLDSVLALRPNTANIIRVSSNMRSGTGTSATFLTVTDTFTLRTEDPPGGERTLLGSLTSKCYAATTLQWLNSSGLHPTSFNETDASVQVQLNTSKNGLATALPTLKAIVAPPDSFRASLPRGPDSLRYSLTVPISYGATTPILTNTTLETKLSDTLVARWTHPRDPQDFARDTLSIRPANRSAVAYFSSHPNGDTVVSRFDTSLANPNLPAIYLIVRDQRGIPGRPYTASVTTTNVNFDQQTFTLTESPTPPAGAPSMTGFSFFSVQIAPLSKATPPGYSKSSAGLQYVANPGDQLAAQYIDPVNGDAANCNAGLNQNPDVPSILQFTDASGSPLVPGNGVLSSEYFWSLANNKVYVKFQAGDSVRTTDINYRTIPVQISATSLRSKKTLSQDSAAVVLSTKQSITKGVASWTGNIDLTESLSPVKLNSALEGAYRIEVTATAPAHDTLGRLTGNLVTAKLVIAWPDSSKAITFIDTVNAADTLGPTSVILTLKDRNFVRNQSNDTVTVTAFCNGGTSTDSVGSLRLIESGANTYISDRNEPLARNTLTPSFTDRILSCPADTGVLIRYADPVYGSPAVSSSDTLTKVIFQAQTPTMSPTDSVFADPISVSLTTPKDNLVQINYTLNSTLPRPGSSPVYSIPITVSGISTPVKAVGSRPGYLRSRIVSRTYLKQPRVLKSYIKDRDRDGRADVIYLVFERTVPNLPVAGDSLSMYWNEELASKSRSSQQNSLSTDSLTLSLLLNTSPFDQYLTGIPIGTTLPPLARFAFGGYFNGLRAMLTDSVGPVPRRAIKHPSDLKATSTDTIIVTISEKLASNNPNGLFRFRAGGCDDASALSFPVPTLGNQGTFTDNDTTYRILVDNTPGVETPVNGDCILLEPGNANYKDPNGNRPGLLGVVLSGGESPKIVDAMDGFPPVAGLDPTSKAYDAANNSDPSRSHVKGAYSWIPSVDFPTGWTKGSKYTSVVTAKNINDTTAATFTSTETGAKAALPVGLSTVQVVASSRYIATVHLTDHLGRFVRSWKQQFGFNGEFSNGLRRTDGGSLSYLAWDGLDSKGNLVGNGVYVWKVNFELPNGKKEVYVTRTGFVR